MTHGAIWPYGGSFSMEAFPGPLVRHSRLRTLTVSSKMQISVLTDDRGKLYVTRHDWGDLRPLSSRMETRRPYLDLAADGSEISAISRRSYPSCTHRNILKQCNMGSADHCTAHPLGGSQEMAGEESTLGVEWCWGCGGGTRG